MTVSTYGDPSQLTVLPLAADLLVPLSGTTVFIVQASDFQTSISTIECLRATLVILRFSTLEVDWKCLLAHSLPNSLCDCTDFRFLTNRKGNFYDGPHGFRK